MRTLWVGLAKKVVKGERKGHRWAGSSLGPDFSMSIPTYLEHSGDVQSHWKIPAFGYINNEDHRLVEPGQIFDERDTSDRAHVLLSGVARITCRNRKGRAQWLSCAPGMIPAFPLPVVGIL